MKVSFYFERDNSNVFAFFPDEQYGTQRDDLFSCYSYDEGHGPCSTEYIKECKKAEFKEFDWLLWHLQNVVGYDNLQIV